MEMLEIRTHGPGLADVTSRLERWIADQNIDSGLLTLLCQHTSASLTIQENADPDVCMDLQTAISGLAPHGGAERYRHHSEGTDDMAAHVRTVLSGVHLSIPIRARSLVLGTWQGVYLWEHRDRPRQRRIAVHLIGE